MSAEEYIRISLLATGRVQGVGFRHFVRRLANCFGVGGRVKNNYDESVSIEVYGAKTNVLAFISSVEKGSLFARVDKLDKYGLATIEKPEDTEFYITR